MNLKNSWSWNYFVFFWDAAIAETREQNCSNETWEEELDSFLEEKETEALEDLFNSFLEEMPEKENDFAEDKIALIKRWEKKRPSSKTRRMLNHRQKYPRQKDSRFTKDGMCKSDHDSLMYAYASSHCNTFTLLTKRDEDAPMPIIEEIDLIPNSFYEHESVKLIVNKDNRIECANIHATRHHFEIDLRVA